MSQHPSLRSSDKDKKHRSVLKRHERIKSLKDKEEWKEEDSVFGLPKVKVLRFKIKKEKAAPAEAAAEGAEAGAAAPAAGQEKATSKGATPVKETAKPQGAEPKKEAKK
ncbi:MAG: small basic protein [Candidatus Omnitrophica bacterium]|nr:small basic protein [Candidatus Omnitrophota bacterium]